MHVGKTSTCGDGSREILVMLRLSGPNATSWRNRKSSSSTSLPSSRFMTSTPSYPSNPLTDYVHGVVKHFPKFEVPTISGAFGSAFSLVATMSHRHKNLTLWMVMFY